MIWSQEAAKEEALHREKMEGECSQVSQVAHHWDMFVKEEEVPLKYSHTMSSVKKKCFNYYINYKKRPIATHSILSHISFQLESPFKMTILDSKEKRDKVGTTSLVLLLIA